MLLKAKLQELTHNNSDSLSELFHSFEHQFPNEKNLIILLRAYIFSEAEDCASEEQILTTLNKLKQ